MTKTKKHHWLFRLWVKIRGLFALLIVLAGVCVGLMSLLLPFESLYQKQLEGFLEKQWGLSVRVKEIEGSWQGYGPYFSLKNLSLTGKQSIDLEAASLSINVYQLLIPGGRTGIDLSVNKAELGMIHSEQGASITINDEKDETKFTEMLDRVLESGSLRVDELVLNVANQNGDILLEGLTADFLLEQDLTSRAFSLLVQNENISQTMEIKSISARSETLSKDARWYIKFTEFEVSQLRDLVNNVVLPEGSINGELWLTAENGSIAAVTGQLDWHSAQSGLSFKLSVAHQGNDTQWASHWRVDDLIIDHQSFADIDFMAQRDGQFSDFRIDGLPLRLVTKVQSLMKPLPSAEQNLLNHLSGEVAPIEVTFDHYEDVIVSGNLAFSDLALQHDKVDFQGLAGELAYANQNFKLKLSTEAGHLVIPELYRDKLQWSEITAQVDVDLQGVNPQVQLNTFWCDCQDFQMNLWMALNLAETKSMLLASQLADVKINQLWKYWPHNVWKDKTLDWLDNSLIDGRVEKGFVFVNGSVVPELFKNGDAEFISRAYVRDATNRFRPDWPQVEKLDATALFTHDVVHVNVESAETKGIKIGASQVDIESIDVGLLTVDMSAHAHDNQVLNYLNQSPLSQNIKLSDTISLQGTQNFDLNFDVQLKEEKAKEFKPQGIIRFKNGTFATEYFTLENINGPVKLSGYDLLIDDLPAALETAPVMLNGSIETQTSEGMKIDVDIDGVLSADLFMEKFNQHIPIKGESSWHINIQNSEDDLLMYAESDLAGVSIDLPAPLYKKADDNQMLKIKCTVPCEYSKVEINYADKINSTIQAASGGYQVSQLNFLDPTKLQAFDEPFGGYIDEVDLDQWLGLVSQSKSENKSEAGTSDLPFSSIELTIKRLTFMSRTFNDVHLIITRTAEAFQVQVDSPAIKGLVDIADDVDRKGIVVQLEKLNWVDANESSLMAVAGTQSKVPDIHLWVEKFSYLDIPLGALRMEMRNVVDGIIVEQLSIKSALAEINVSGDWNKAIGPQGQSHFDVVMFSERIADFLETVGFEAPITNAQTLIKMKAIWDGVPSEFDMAKVDGELDIKLGQGQVLDQKPGFGRVLGLFNLTNLPRRLILDFRDVLAEGLLFRSMEGHFVIAKGVANTQDFLIKASSAKILLHGDVGFDDQSYDQTITIQPQIGKTFPTIGAIAGGPVGAAAGFLVQGLFDKQLKNKNEIIYRVTGTWDEPVIELLTDE